MCIYVDKDGNTSVDASSVQNTCAQARDEKDTHLPTIDTLRTPKYTCLHVPNQDLSFPPGNSTHKQAGINRTHQPAHNRATTDTHTHTQQRTQVSVRVARAVHGTPLHAHMLRAGLSIPNLARQQSNPQTSGKHTRARVSEESKKARAQARMCASTRCIRTRTRFYTRTHTEHHFSHALRPRWPRWRCST